MNSSKAFNLFDELKVVICMGIRFVQYCRSVLPVLFLLAGNWLFAQENVTHSIVLLGDTQWESQENVEILSLTLKNADEKTTVLMLGNIFSDKALLDEDGKVISLSERLPAALLASDAKVAFVPGPTEWDEGGSNGKAQVKAVRKALRKTLGKSRVLMPEQACPGPEEIALTDKVVLILIDSQWWLHPFDRRYQKCGLEEDSDAWVWLQDALRRNRDKQIIVAGHHPIYSAGPHAGHFPATTDWLGFPYAWYKKAFGGRQDFAHPEYKLFVMHMKQLLSQFPNVIYASAHDKSLQYLFKEGIHQIISGSLTDQTYVDEKQVTFGSQAQGLARLDFFEDGTTKLSFETMRNGKEETIYSYTIGGEHGGGPSGEKQTAAEESGLTHTLPASLQYEATPRYEKWMGANYRDVWATPVEVPVFDIGKERGGLTILKRGGGQQTRSIRMEDAEGRQYVLRSMEKYAEGALPDEMANTLAVDVVQDQISASNPYAAVPVARLAEAAGVYHTNPSFVYVPNDDRLKEYKDDLSGGIFLYEERPAGNRQDVASFGNSKKLVNTDEVLEQTEDDEDHRVDHLAVLKARIFDTYINDWDRHDDQWRWASFKTNGQTIYKPIPRDRDQAFFVNEGIIPWLASRKWLMSKIQNFQPRTENVSGLIFNARYFDRTFLTEPDWETWSAMVDTVLSAMTDAAIDSAMATFPIEVQPLCADEIGTILKQRRAYLKEMAREHYLFINEKVNVVGTNRRDYFDIERLNDDQTRIRVWHIKKDGSKGKTIYERTFRTDETKEILCYGLDGKDQFELSGTVKKGPCIRIISGSDKDKITDNSSVRGWSKKTRIYDLKKSTTVQASGETALKLSGNKIVNEYDREDFRYNVTFPAAYFGYNPDDGAFIGGGPAFHRYKFRREEVHTLLANYAWVTHAFNVLYDWQSHSSTNGFDYGFKADIKAPNYVTNYFGMGNETSWLVPTSQKNYYRVRQKQVDVEARFGKRFGKTTLKRYPKEEANTDHPVDEHRLWLSGGFQAVEVESTADRFISDFGQNDLSPMDFNWKNYLKLGFDYRYQKLDRTIRPTRGLVFETGYNYWHNTRGGMDNFHVIDADLVTYFSFNPKPRTVFAFRFGGAKYFGNHPFFESAILGGRSNLRGFRASRFAGDASFYQNTEVRMKLIDFTNYILNGEIGVLAFNDVGRVWLDGEESSRWHDGYGGGFWIAPFNASVLSLTYERSKEDKILQFRFNFMF